MPLAANHPRSLNFSAFARAALAAAPLAVAPACVLALGSRWADWQRMVAVAVAVFAAAKWLSFAEFLEQVLGAGKLATPMNALRIAGYFTLWPGMDPRPFFTTSAAAPRPHTRDWFSACGKTLLGLIVLAAAARHAAADPFLAGWLGIAGFLLALHFGSFHLLSLGWRRAGIAAVPIMNAPFVAASLADFWGRRWNLAFRDLAHRFVFRPTVAAFGPAVATLLVFLTSGLAHDAVVSLPVRGGYGGPTAYFLIQGLAMLFERTVLARRIGIGRGRLGWAYTQLVVFAPAALLFHRPFVERAMAPLLVALPF